MEKIFGFVYLWYDKRTNWFYLGSHYGTPDDSYICSNKPMLRSHKKRPNDFKRRIIHLIFHDDRRAVLLAEQKYLNLIKESELLLSKNIQNGTTRYFNIKRTAFGGSQKGHKKNRLLPRWNLGVTKEMQVKRKSGLFYLLEDRPKTSKGITREMRLLKTHDLFCYLTDRPKISKSKIAKPISDKNTQQPIKKRATQIYETACLKCGVNFKQECKPYQRLKCCSKKCAHRYNASKTNRAENGRKRAAIQAKTVTGRRRFYRNNGSWCWVYPEKSAG